MDKRLDEKIEKTFSIQKTLLDQIEILAQQLNISQTQLLETALEDFIKKSSSSLNQVEQSQPVVINQGDVYWLRDNSGESEAGIPHPHVVIQDNVFNHSRIQTVVTCALTSNIKRVSIPGNVLVEAGEANLPRQSVVEVSKVAAVEKAHLGEYIGSLDERRIAQILAGMRFLQNHFEFGSRL
jgi:mRNA interferase MazF